MKIIKGTLEDFSNIYIVYFELLAINCQVLGEDFMIACVDVDYKGDKACAACIVFEKWSSAGAYKKYKVIVDDILDYEPGQFYKRELPCVVKVLNIVSEKIDAIIVDGYVWLDSNKRPGMGAYLYNYLEEKIPVIGVAKTKFHEENKYVMEVFRGRSENPLYITAASLPLDDVAAKIKQMHGNYRIPTILKEVDKLCRSWQE